MQAVTPVLLTDHNGVERQLRFTPGARKRIAERFGTENFISIASKQGDWAFYEIAWILMHDREGKPPADLPLNDWMEESSGAEPEQVAAAILSAVSQGRTPKNELEEMLVKARGRQMQELIGSPSGLSAASVSDSPTESTGGDTPTPS